MVRWMRDGVGQYKHLVAGCCLEIGHAWQYNSRGFHTLLVHLTATAGVVKDARAPDPMLRFVLMLR
jgi:hypothetical protein